MKDSDLKLLDLWEKLVDAGYSVSVRLNSNYTGEINVNMCKDLIKLHKILGLPIAKETREGFMVAYAKTPDKDLIRIWPDGSVFLGCKLVPEDTLVPEHLVPMHRETKWKVVCNERAVR